VEVAAVITILQMATMVVRVVVVGTMVIPEAVLQAKAILAEMILMFLAMAVAAVALLVLLVVMEALLRVVMAVMALRTLLVALLSTTLAVVPLTYGRVRVEVLRRELLDLAAVVQVITLLVELMQPQIRVAVEDQVLVLEVLVL
jgi:hypothetical protein